MFSIMRGVFTLDWSHPGWPDSFGKISKIISKNQIKSSYHHSVSDKKPSTLHIFVKMISRLSPISPSVHSPVTISPSLNSLYHEATGSMMEAMGAKRILLDSSDDIESIVNSEEYIYLSVYDNS